MKKYIKQICESFFDNYDEEELEIGNQKYVEGVIKNDVFPGKVLFSDDKGNFKIVIPEYKQFNALHKEGYKEIGMCFDINLKSMKFISILPLNINERTIFTYDEAVKYTDSYREYFDEAWRLLDKDELKQFKDLWWDLKDIYSIFYSKILKNLQMWLSSTLKSCHYKLKMPEAKEQLVIKSSKQEYEVYPVLEIFFDDKDTLNKIEI